MTPSDAADGIGARILSGVAWKAGSQAILQISRLVVALILARLLAPHAWGVAAMVMLFASFVVVFTDSALGTALIQRTKLEEEDKSTVFWLSAIVGVALAVGGFAVSGTLARFYREPSVRPLFAALSIGFLISALGTTQLALLARDMQFRRLELRQIAATLIGAGTGVAIALAGFGPWAIVGQQLAEVSTSTVVLWYVCPWKPSRTFSVASLQRLGGFAGNVFGENLLYQTGKNLSGLVIGRVLGAAAIGTYVLATNVILVPFTRIAAPLQQVFFPAFSRINHDKARLADVWIRATRLVGLISIPSLVGLAILAPEFVDVVLGERWHAATPIIQILAWVGIVQSLQTLSGEALMAVGRAGTLFRFTMVWFVGTVVALAVGLHWGIVGVAVAYAVVTSIVEPLRTYLTARALEISPWRFYGAFGGIAQATLVMALGVLAAKAAMVGAGLPTSVRLPLLIVVGVSIYVPACLLRARDATGDITGTLARRFRRSGRPLEPLGPGV